MVMEGEEVTKDDATAVNIPSDTSSPLHGVSSISLTPPSHNSNLTPSPATPTSPSSILWGPSLTRTSPSSPTYGNRVTSTKSDVLSHSDEDTTTCLRDSVSLHDGDHKGWGSSEFEERVAQVIKRVTGEGVTEEMPLDTSLRYSQEHRPRPRCRNSRQHRSGPRQQQHDPQGERQSSKGPITVANTNNTLLSMHSAPSISPTLSCVLCQYPASSHLYPPAPSPPKRRSLSLPPTFHRLKNSCEQQLLRPKPNVHAMGRGNRSLLSICQHNPSRGPSTADFSPSSCQRHHDTQNECSSVPAYSTSVYTSHARKPRKLKDKAEVWGANGQYSKEIEVAAEGEEVTGCHLLTSPLH